LTDTQANAPSTPGRAAPLQEFGERVTSLPKASVDPFVMTEAAQDIPEAVQDMPKHLAVIERAVREIVVQEPAAERAVVEKSAAAPEIVVQSFSLLEPTEEKPARAAADLTEAASGDSIVETAPPAFLPPVPSLSSSPKAPMRDDPGLALRSVADWCARADTIGPVRLGLFGPAGSGKSFALARILDNIKALSKGADSASPFAQNILVVKVDAGEGRAPACALAAAVYAAMNAPDAPPAFAALAQEAALSGADTQAEARAASDRLIEARRGLDAERQTLQELTGRSALLGETVLYQAGGSRIDSWARANRTRIESRLRAFGFDVGDTLATYKDLVRDVAERRGFVGRAGVYLHALWGFTGQARLLAFAAALTLLAWGLGQNFAGQPEWLASITGWLQAKGDLSEALRSLSLWGALALVALNVFRAMRFVAPLSRGADLLAVDVQGAQRDLDGLISQQTRLVDGLVAETEAYARNAQACERRAALQGEAKGASAATPFDDAAEAAIAQARGFFAAIAREAGSGSASAPQKVLVAVDDLDVLSPGAAAHFVDEAARVLSSAPFILLVAADARRLSAGWGKDLDEAAGGERLGARVDAALQIGAASQSDLASMARGLLEPANARDSETFDVAHSLHDEAMSAHERALLEDLAPYAASTPRDVERFVLTYRLARPRMAHHGALALALAMQTGASEAARSALADMVGSKRDEDEIIAPQSETKFAEALKLALRPGPISVGDWRKAQALAADYRLS
jgi:hypothetical protein